MELERFLEDSPVCHVVVVNGRTQEVGDEGTLAVKNRIYRKVAQRLGELGIGNSEPEPVFYLEMTPDIVVISDDQSLLFEAQNARALELLTQVCGFSSKTIALFERIRVHPCRSHQIIDRLKAAGATVAI